MRKDLSDATEVVKTRRSNRKNLKFEKKRRIKKNKTANSGEGVNNNVRRNLIVGR